MKAAKLLMVVFASVVALSACGGCSMLEDKNPHSAATSPEQHAFALYGEWVIAKEAAADIVELPSTPQNVRTAVAAADLAASPIADEMQDAAVEVFKINAQLGQGDNTQEKLNIAIANLDDWVKKFEPQIARLSAALNKGDEK